MRFEVSAAVGIDVFFLVTTPHSLVGTSTLEVIAYISLKHQ